MASGVCGLRLGRTKYLLTIIISKTSITLGGDLGESLVWNILRPSLDNVEDTPSFHQLMQMLFKFKFL